MVQESLLANVEANLIKEIPYEGSQSPEFDALLYSREHVHAEQGSLTEPTKDKVLSSGWHVPCHCIVTRTPDGICQIFHILPNKLSHSLLTVDQGRALKEVGQKGAIAIVAKGIRSWFSNADIGELGDLNIKLKEVISVDSTQWWRFLYDPKINEAWVDIQEKQLLRKYRGFNTNE